MASVLDKTFTLRQVRNWLLVALVFGAVWYGYHFFTLAWSGKVGGLAAAGSPYYNEIPENCRQFSERHLWSTGNVADNLALRVRAIRRNASYLTPDYGGVRCLGYAVLTGLHAQDPLSANFVDTYVDGRGKPIVRVSVEYFQTYTYNPNKSKLLSSESAK